MQSHLWKYIRVQTSDWMTLHRSMWLVAIIFAIIFVNVLVYSVTQFHIPAAQNDIRVRGSSLLWGIKHSFFGTTVCISRPVAAVIIDKPRVSNEQMASTLACIDSELIQINNDQTAIELGKVYIYGYCGWPFTSMHGNVSFSYSENSITSLKKNCIVLREKNLLSGDRPIYLLYGIQWLGLAGNVVTWLLISIVIIIFYYVLKWIQRRARGQCVYCGYNTIGIAANKKCPECGNAFLTSQHCT